jgi:transcriptional regulator with XRE-family HTH domain
MTADAKGGTGASGEAPGAGAMRIGVRVRHARMTKGMRLKEVAARAGCSESLLSKVENDKVMPSLHMLHRLAEALGITIGELFARSNEPDRVVTKAGERPLVTLDPLRRGTGIRLERLIPHGHGHLLQGNIHILAPDATTDGTIEHSGEEIGYVLEGRIELTVGGETHVVEAGDSFHYRSELPHGYRNLGPGPARVLFINTPPTF